MTHVHADTVGSLPGLLKQYPGVKIVSHIDERPFLTEGKNPRGLKVRKFGACYNMIISVGSKPQHDLANSHCCYNLIEMLVASNRKLSYLFRQTSDSSTVLNWGGGEGGQRILII